MQKNHFKLRAVKMMQLFCLLLSLMLLCTMIPVGVLAVEALTFDVSTEAELRAAVSSVPVGGEATITLLAPISLTGTPLVIPASRRVTLAGNDLVPIALSGASGYDAVQVAVQAVLTIDGINITHNAGGTGRGVYVLSGGTLVLESGKISGNSGALGGGVYNLGRFVMNGGEISGNSASNSGGGIRNDGTFELTGGVIELNSGKWFGGGVYNHDRANFIMTGGWISNNQAPEGGGVYNAIGGRFTLTDGYIQGNAATGALGVSAGVGGGVYNGSGNTYFTMEGGVISGNSAQGCGGGVVNKGVFLMADGKISGNIVTTDGQNNYGGGVWNTANGTFTMTGGEISGNEASRGGGVANYMGAGSDKPVFKMEDGKILGNMARLGGGVYNSSTTEITLGNLSGNSAYDGGGVYNTGTLAVAGGVFHLNVAENDGGGIWVAYQNLDKVSVGQDAFFTENSACLSCGRNPIDDALYAAQILCTSWTHPLTQGYNNYDISYRYDPKGSLSFTKKVEDMNISAWLADKGLGLGILDGLRFYLNGIGTDGKAYSYGPASPSGLTSEVKFGNIYPGTYTLSEEIAGAATGVFKKMADIPNIFIGDGDDKFFVLGGTVTGNIEGKDIEPDDKFTVVNGYGQFDWGYDENGIGYPGLNSSGHIFYIGVTNNRTGEKLYSFCANGESTQFGDGPYLVAHSMKELDWIMAFNYINDKYGDLNKNRVVTQLVTWALLGAVDVNSEAFNNTILKDDEKAAIKDVMDNYSGYVGNGGVVDVLFMTDVNTPFVNGKPDYKNCQPQIVPIFGKFYVENEAE